MPEQTHANPANAPIAVIGAGIIGACVAACLQRDGHAVMLVDPDEPGAGASSGNAGMLSTSSIIPVGMPGIARKVPGWLLDPHGPLTLRWRYLPAIAPWLLRLLRSATPDKVELQARALRSLLQSSLENYRPLVADAGAGHLVHQRGTLYLYASEQSWRADALNTAIRRRNGIRIDDVVGADLRALEPDLAPAFTHARLVRANGHVSHPRALVQALVAHAASGGARVLRECVRGFEHNGAQVTAVLTGEARHAVRGVVLSCGAWSRTLATELGDRVPLDTERGYHITIANPEKGPRTPTLYVDGNVGVTPMDMGLRFTGTVELAGLQAPPDWRRADGLLDKARALYPGLVPASATTVADASGRVTRWMGFRPSMPDSLPVIGPSSRFGNAWYAFGHGHSGMCAASTTGRLIADLVAGRAPCIPSAPFSAQRFY